MTDLFIKNSSGQSNGLRIKKSIDSIISNEGIEGSVTTTGRMVDMCLSPQTTIPPGNVNNQYDGIGFEGQFVIEVNGEIVPHYFNEDQLPKYFDGLNTSGIGVKIFAPGSIKLDVPAVPDIGGMVQLTFQYTGTDPIVTTEWTSSNHDVALVNEGGLMTMMGYGTTVIGVLVNGELQDSVTVELTTP